MAHELVLADVADEERRRTLHERLSAYNNAACPQMEAMAHPGCLDVYLLGKRGQVLGGLLGLVRWHWLYVDDFALHPSMRRQGHGRRMLLRAEAEAQRRGCRHAMLHTMSFQARPFYEKLGYRVIGLARDWPPGAVMYWLTKELAAAPQEPPAEVTREYRLVVSDTVDEGRQRQVGQFLKVYNSQHNEHLRRGFATGHWSDALDVYLVDGLGNLAGGLKGGTIGRWLNVQELWLDEGRRGQGWGRRMLALAEGEACRRGCDRAQAQIHSFQAPGFWRALGYRASGEIADYPPGSTFSWLQKDLRNDSPST